MTQRSEIDIAVGRVLNRLRQERQLTVTALAEASGVSAAMISRIENGQVSPSLSTLNALAGAMSVPVMALLADNDHTADIHHVKAGQGLPSRRVAQNHAHEYLLLGKHSGPGGNFQAARIRIDREDAGMLPTYQHEGQVFLYVLTGGARYQCGSEQFELCAGDTLSFDAKLPHGFVGIRDDHVEFITVSSRPT
ncbi:helix-turn-helix domain-containing protein [Aliiroseovarius sp. 2305UL8-7]|uniref:helix-turn-helix domain-containing protein n=1 Tax=Aliiroseovarius conchicola TaxID=3121637 RepID=UPI00352904E4